ncbi:DUF5050 domain-containing protein [Clostridium sp. 19966]|uniref:DUF5050 domain-containing protein n=1 Tax=Clostridium sp. 19966 TaxID=2768166 RepID=UPI0028DE1841|nr:DUF5050 domain-containing protein [Clostridium sp. 19966]MDT8716152.1 DUF5050 domain-containing protein [Clostridium sp. 19966]
MKKLKRLKILVIFLLTISTSVYVNEPWKVRAETINKDLNSDGVVDMLDYNIEKQYYNTNNSIYDLNKDGKIDIYDLTLLSKAFDDNFKDNGYYSIGNTQSNLMNSSYAVYRDGWIYYRNTQEQNSLYVSKPNSESRKKLTDDQVSGINVIGDNIFYINESDGNKIYTIKKDGTGRKLLINNSASNLIVSGGYIFYINSNNIRRTSIDGTNDVLLTKDAVKNFTINALKLYYINNSDSKIYSIGIDGDGKNVVENNTAVNFAVNNNMLYYINASDNKIYSLNTENNSENLLINSSALAINYDDGNIYYSSKEDGTLYKYIISTAQCQQIGKETVSTDIGTAKISVKDGYVFYTNANDENRLYSIMDDGSSKKDMETVINGQASTTVNFRVSPDTSSSIITTLKSGDKVQILGKVHTSSYNWYKIICTVNGENKVGYSVQDYFYVLNDDRMDTYLGVLSAKYESNGDPGSISSGSGDVGGKSYGAWQFSSNVGTVDSFLVYLHDNELNFYNTLNSAKQADGGSFGSNFDNAWKQIASSNYVDFLQLQKDFTKTMYYDRAVKLIEKNMPAIKVSTEGFPYKNVVWSTAVQHGVVGAAGPGEGSNKTGVITAVYNSIGTGASEDTFINAVYKERSKFSVYFPSYPADSPVLKALATRYKQECNDALTMGGYPTNP